jgi:hypothetical protein
MIDSERDEWTSKRAYALWELSGREDGHDREHWEQAIRERDELERTRASTDGQEVLIRFRLKSPDRIRRNSAPVRETRNATAR